MGGFCGIPLLHRLSSPIVDAVVVVALGGTIWIPPAPRTIDSSHPASQSVSQLVGSVCIYKVRRLASLIFICILIIRPHIRSMAVSLVAVGGGIADQVGMMIMGRSNPGRSSAIER